jgi:hypothetical protein
MAHFAKINENNIVEQVIVISNEDCGNEEYPQSESIGQEFIQSLNLIGVWKQTSYNNTFRKNYAGIGFTFDEERDAFIPIKPFDSWVLDEHTCKWKAPIPYPSDGNEYIWNEELLSWEEVV